MTSVTKMQWAMLLLGLAVLGFVHARQQVDSRLDVSPSAWISDVGPASRGRPLSVVDGGQNLQRISLGTAKREKGARFFNLPEVGQYLVRVKSPVRKNLAADLRSIAAGSVRYLPHDTFVAVLHSSSLQAVMDVNGVEDLLLRSPESKVARELFQENQHLNVQRRRSDPDIIAVVAELVEARGRDDWSSRIESTLEEWRTSLKAIAGPKFDISLQAKKYVTVHTDVEHMDSTVYALAEHPLVAAVSGENVAVEPQNYLAGEVIQSSSGASEHRVWDKGITGDGEIVSIHDSGLDFDMGWFSDSTESIAFCGADVQTTYQFAGACQNLAHRKIVSYRQTTGTDYGVYDPANGHGTHVAGIIAGSREDGDYTVEGTGMCPMCKIVIDDLDETDTYSLYTGPSLANLVQHSYDVGSRIHSASIGKPQHYNWYGAFSQQWDDWLATNDDALILSAAGNYGAFEAEFSVVDPAPAKNTVTVGATQNGRRSSRYNDDNKPDSTGASGTNRVAFGAQSTQDTRRDFLSFRYDQWDRFVGQTGKNLLDARNYSFGGKDDRVGDYYKSPRMEVKEVEWGKKLGSNEVVRGPVIGMHICGCVDVTEYPFNYPDEPWTLILVWDWGFTPSQCDNDVGNDPYGGDFPAGFCVDKDTSWANIENMYTNHNMQGVLLVEPDCAQGVDACSGAAADEDQWWILDPPTGLSSSNRAAFPVGQVQREGRALQAFLTGNWYWYYFNREFYYNYYGGDPSYAYIWDDYYAKGTANTPSLNTITNASYADSMYGEWPHRQHSYIASISSRGPTLDLRFIPDIMCPGDQLKSAASDSDPTSGTSLYNLTLKTGTSMATPVCAGGAALIRQYLREGWYGDGTSGSGAAIASPSGALIKAMMINSAQPTYALDDFGNSVINYYEMSRYPNFASGFGRLALDKVLMFDDSAFNLKFGERIPIDQSQTLEICVSVTDASEPLVVTITWPDPAAVENSIINLVNDLDLVVVSEAGDFYYGNNIMWTDESNTAGRAVRDSRNTVERVTIDVPVVGKYSIRIAGTDVPDGPQNVAFVMTGIFSDAEGTCGALDECENSCNGHGTCNCPSATGISSGCMCDAGWSGTDCSFSDMELTSSDHTISLGAASTAYYVIDASSCSDFTVTWETTAGAAYVLIAEGVHPVDYGSQSAMQTGINERLYYAAYGTPVPASPGSYVSRLLPDAPSGVQTFTATAAATGKWVMSVTSLVDPFAGDENPMATTTTVTARVVLTGTTGCPAPVAITPDCSATPPEIPAGGGGGSACPTQDAAYAACSLAYTTWPEITALYESNPSQLYVGGLGGKMVVDKCESWVCVTAAHVTGCTPGDWLCFYYDESSMEFIPWGVNGDLEIF